MDTPQVLLDHHLKTLRLPTFLRAYDKVAQQCAAEGMDFPHYLLRLSELELLDRERRATEGRIRQAKFDVVKSLDTFDFLALPSLKKSLVLDLARCEFIERKENILALGNSGTGKHTSRWPSAWPLARRVHINENQGNAIQPDLNFRGYTASPLPGTPQGISTYMDDVRLNQPFLTQLGLTRTIDKDIFLSRDT